MTSCLWIAWLCSSVLAGSLRFERGQEVAIDAAVLPLPVAMRADATVVTSDADGMTIELRGGSNGVTCRTDFPAGVTPFQFLAVCYHDSMHAFFTRDIQLTARGLGREQIRARLTEEIRSGELETPSHPAAGYFLGGSAYDERTGEVESPLRWQVLFTPFMTANQVGVPDHEVAGTAWMMNSGGLRAHIMLPTEGGD